MTLQTLTITCLKILGWVIGLWLITWSCVRISQKAIYNGSEEEYWKEKRKKQKHQEEKENGINIRL